MKPVISPSILSCDFLNIENELNALQNIEDIWIHLDIMDGHFVTNLTFGFPVVKRISQFSTKPLDAHLMVTNPEFHIEQMKNFKLHNITFHREVVPDSLALIKKAKEHYPSVGISIKPKTSQEDLDDDILRAVDLVLVMSVEPGHGGQSFIPSSLEKVATLKKRKKELSTPLIIQIDGGINEQTARQAISSGADNLVAGSAVFKKSQKDYPDNIQRLRS